MAWVFGGFVESHSVVRPQRGKGSLRSISEWEGGRYRQNLIKDLRGSPFQAPLHWPWRSDPLGDKVLLRVKFGREYCVQYRLSSQ